MSSCYAVLLKGSQPSAVDKLYQFDSVSVRNEWLADMREQDKLVVKVNYQLMKRLSKTHLIIHTKWVSNKNWMRRLTEFAGGWVEHIVQKGE